MDKDTLIPTNQGDDMANYPAFLIVGAQKGDWIKVPLNLQFFNYTGLQNFVVQMEMDTCDGITLLFTHATGQDYRLLKTPKDSIWGISQHILIDLGFDVSPTGVEESGNITSFGLFPNPAIDGRFNVSFDAKTAVRDVTLSATSVTGQRVWGGSYTNAGSSFFLPVNLNMLAKGLYFIHVKVDGESLTRTVVID